MPSPEPPSDDPPSPSLRITCRQSSGFEGGKMKGLTRRSFLSRSTVGVALAGALAMVPFIATAIKQQATTPPGIARTAIPGGGPLVAHVRDLASGEVAVLVGSQRFVIRDRELAVRLHAAPRGVQ